MRASRDLFEGKPEVIAYYNNDNNDNNNNNNDNSNDNNNDNNDNSNDIDYDNNDTTTNDKKKKNTRYVYTIYNTYCSRASRRSSPAP